MSDSEEYPFEKPFEFYPEYAQRIAMIAEHWASTEYYVNALIWALAGVAPGLGACMTSQIYTFNGRVSALLSLLKLRQVDAKIISSVNKLAESSRGPAELRNRTLHDIWARAPEPGLMGRIEVTAAKKLKFDIVPISIEALENDLRALDECRTAWNKIRREIEDLIPSLPPIPHEALHPITEHRLPLRTRSSEKK